MSDSLAEIRGETPEPSAQPSPVLEAIQAHGDDTESTMAEPLAWEMASKHKRKISEVASRDDDDEGSDTARSKRRKGSKDQPAKSTQDVRMSEVSPSPKAIPQKQEVLPNSGGIGDDSSSQAGPTIGIEVEDEAAASIAGQPDMEMAEVEEDAEADEGNYIHDAYVARVGLINGCRIARLDANDSKLASTRIYHHEHKGVKQTVEQVRLESFFMTLDTGNGYLKSTNAGLRVQFVEPYDNIDEKLGEWSQMFLIMRLNLLESLQQVDRVGTIKFDGNVDKIMGDGEEPHEQRLWKETKKEAKRLRLSLERAQILLKDPINWSKYEKGPDRHPVGSKKDGNVEKDGNDGQERVKDTIKQKPRVKPPPSAARQSSAGTAAFTTPAAKSIASWEDLRFPPEKEKEFQMLLASEKIGDIDSTRQPDPHVREHYAGEEYRFLYRWMEAKDDGGRTRWVDHQPACEQLELAHKHFFTNYPFEGGTQSKTRKGRAILRALAAASDTNAAVREKFARFAPTKTRAVGGAVGEQDKDTQDLEKGGAKVSEDMEMVEVGRQKEDIEYVSDQEQGEDDGSVPRGDNDGDISEEEEECGGNPNID
ncbi:hypothetical protein FKW77_006664 [Venturia effusa]|uniref:Uncharacterized protein n=1 Tax=Venturia effusa TaxID=50376 RepID=A0A517LDX6_9PEZI|nr:hypothetical protein FKW77_006664 [Venturia effusa]